MRTIDRFPISNEDIRQENPDNIVVQLNSILDGYGIPDETTDETILQQTNNQEVILGIKQIYSSIAQELNTMKLMLDSEPVEGRGTTRQNIGRKHDILVSYLSDITSLIKKIIISCEIHQIRTIKTLLDMIKKDNSAIYGKEFKRILKTLVNQKKISTKKSK